MCWEDRTTQSPVEATVPNHRKAGWDIVIPDEHRHMVMDMLRQMADIRLEKWPRSVVPPTTKYPLNLQLIYCSDGGSKCSGTGVWARIEEVSGSFQCQLMLGHSELSRETVPRNELLGAAIGVNLVGIVQRATNWEYKPILCAVDNQVAMSWMHNPDLKLK